MAKKVEESSPANPAVDCEMELTETTESLDFLLKEKKLKVFPRNGGAINMDLFLEMIKRISTNLCKIKPQLEKQGLGIKDRPKKVAGVLFRGKKTSFSDSEDENSDDFGSPAKRMRENASELEKADEPRLKLKKLCKQLVQQVLGESLKLKRLKVLIDEQSSSFFPTILQKKRLLPT
ncbi:hypothetical protein PTKIN_Ptkin05aG0061300 [Pterospermum kingtungense]